jgi:hypothetical protein
MRVWEYESMGRSSVNRQPSTVNPYMQHFHHLSCLPSNDRYMGRGFGLIPLIFLLPACLKNTQMPAALSGTYIGVYMRVDHFKDTAAIEITFRDNSFQDKYNTTVHPNCHGFYRISNDSIDFQNLCDTPNYRLILDGKFRVVQKDDSLSLSRISNGTFYFEDHFNLRKQ